MLLSRTLPARCIHCAFRARQRTLAAFRLTSSSSGRLRTRRKEFGATSPRKRAAVAELDPGSKIPTWLYKPMGQIRRELKDSPSVVQLIQERQADGYEADFDTLWESFKSKIVDEKCNLQKPEARHPWPRPKDNLYEQLERSYFHFGITALCTQIKYAFYGDVASVQFSEFDIRNQKRLADLRYPSEWFPATRTLRRTIHLHVGPTNSGKTYNALKRLEQARRGIYAGPLRLLAQEIYARLNASGRPCALVTGEERRSAPASPDSAPSRNPDEILVSCTVEMVQLNRTFDVAVIDEIQMIGNRDRGWAWTQALLGVKAAEVHLCGEARTVPLIQEICSKLGEKLEIHHYERLSPLEMEHESLDGDLKKLKKGDCIVSFSVMAIHALRKQIEKMTKKKVAIVYGTLPPETRSQQARFFNDPNNDYDYLVASDAVGMGLNLAIKRIVFETALRFDGFQHRVLNVADVKQIAGRAGRYKVAGRPVPDPVVDTPANDADATEADQQRSTVSTGDEETRVDDTIGKVTTLDGVDFPIISRAMSLEPEPIKSACLMPPHAMLERFALYFPPYTPFAFMLKRLHEIMNMHPRFHLAVLKDQIWIADIIENVKGLTIADRSIFCAAPFSTRFSKLDCKLLPAFAHIAVGQRSGHLAEIPEMPLEVLDRKESTTRVYLTELEELHHGLIGYLWLSYRFAGVFSTRMLAFHAKELVEAKIERCLSSLSSVDIRKKALARKLAQKLANELKSEDIGDVGNSMHLKTDKNVNATSQDQPSEGEEPEPIMEPAPGELDPPTGLSTNGDIGNTSNHPISVDDV